MPQMALSGKTQIVEWYDNHEADYEAVRKRLRSARSALLYGSINHAAENLRLSYLNAVFSIQTKKERHERAFSSVINGTDPTEAAKQTLYGNQKAGWIDQTLSNVDWKDIAERVRRYVKDGDFLKLLDMEDELTGVSYTKWAFTLCMCGVWELACFDSNTQNFFDIDDVDCKTAADYYQLISRLQEVGFGSRPFVIQWVIYDFMRGEHARHMPFYRNICMQ